MVVSRELSNSRLLDPRSRSPMMHGLWRHRSLNLFRYPSHAGGSLPPRVK